MADSRNKIPASRKFKVELWVNTIGTTPEAKLIKIVEAANEKAAVDKARSMAKIENPEVNAMQIDTMIAERLYH